MIGGETIGRRATKARCTARRRCTVAMRSEQAEEARKLMSQVEQVYEESRSFHVVGTMEDSLVAPEADESERPQLEGEFGRGEIEVWFERPRLRLDWTVQIIPAVACSPSPMVGGVEGKTDSYVAVVDGDHEYRLSNGRWTKRKVGRCSPTLREAVGLPSGQAQYLTKAEAELSGRPMWMASAEVTWEMFGTVAVTWWIDKTDLTVAKYMMEWGMFGPFGPDVPLEVRSARMRQSVVFHRVEPNVEVPDGVFDVPSDLPLKRPVTLLDAVLTGVRGGIRARRELDRHTAERK
jgi:hypothetical protein